MCQEVIGGYLPSGTILSSGLRHAFPFVVLAVLLVARPAFRAGTPRDPLAGVTRPRRVPGTSAHDRGGHRFSRAFAALGAFVFVIVALVVVPGNWEFTLTQGLVLAIVFLSITLLTGLGGQISLCQAVFAGVGSVHRRPAGHALSTSR